MKVLVTDNMAKEAVDILEASGKIEVDVKNDLAPEELLKIVDNYDAMAIRGATKVTAEVLDKATKLKVVGRAGTGTDNVDKDAATRKGVVVMNVPGGNTVTTAEHAFSMMCALARHIPQATASMKGGKWEKKKFKGVELYKKTLGVLGLGAIGKVVADRAVGYKMKVIAYDPFVSAEAGKDMGVEMVSLDDLWARSDFISIHVPKNKDTVGLVGKDAFKKMKDGVRIIQCSRGGILDEAALKEALDWGKVAGAALDVYEQEPPASDHPLFAYPNCIFTPHLGASTEEAQVNVAVGIAEQIAAYLETGTIMNAVNFPSVTGEVLAKLQPYITLAERMGRFLMEVYPMTVETFDIQYRGEVAKMDVAPVTIAAIKGVLSPVLSENINYVSAPAVAKDRGIKVNESKSTSVEAYTSTIAIHLTGGGHNHTITGALFGKDDIRIVEVTGIFLEAIPEGCMIVLQNEDQVGVISGISKVLAENGLNISRFMLGRDKPGGRALSIIKTDAPASKAVLDALGQVSHVIRVTQLEM